MADVHSKEVRSFNMSRIKGKDTKPEMIVRKFLHSNGFRYGLYSKYLPGKPDIVLKKYKTIVDVRGCFWHGHKNCKFGDLVKIESAGIADRIKSAIDRDKIKSEKWKRMGWQFIIVWDSCELETKRRTSLKREHVLMRLMNKLKKIDTSN